jgi:hypothetical protein
MFEELVLLRACFVFMRCVSNSWFVCFSDLTCSPQVATTLQEVREGKRALLPSDPGSYFFPLAIWVSGPLHLAWNAFETSAKGTEVWESYRDFISAITAFLGHQGIRDRFREKCLGDADASERSHFFNWKHHVIDWKWEYMEEIFQQLSCSVGVFLLHYDARKMRQSGDTGDLIAIDRNCLKTIDEAQQHRLYYMALAEAHALFSREVGKFARWFGGCPCHDHIWCQDISDEAKNKLFVKEIGVTSGVKECIWRGRRGSELARGHWKTLLDTFRAATSTTLQHRLVPLPAAERARVTHALEIMKTTWREELSAKLRYWDELPHALLGVWPNDSKSKEMAQKALQKWELISGTDKEKHMHRVTYRLLHPQSGTNFHSMLKTVVVQ